MPLFAKHFTLEEARAWLPELRSRFEHIHSLYAEMQELQADFEKAQRTIRGNGHAPKSTAFEERARSLAAVVQEIIEAGIEIKDVARGLVDFPHVRAGEEVFLCWELAEEDIRFWHAVDAGYAGRQPLDA